MSGSIHGVDSQRSRWVTHRRRQRLIPEAGNDFGRGGLGGLVDNLDVRLLLLTSDPQADVVSLNGDTLEWLKTLRPSPYGGEPVVWGRRTRATSSAVCVYDQSREDRGWDRYLALHRHGGIEAGSGRAAYEIRETRVFPLRRLVGMAWSILALHAEAADRWPLDPPFELTVALRDTQHATLGGFADGWAEPFGGLSDVSTCLDEHVLLRWEMAELPAVEGVALDVGNRLEQAFGTVLRRHPAGRGRYEGRFDPQFQV